MAEGIVFDADAVSKDIAEGIAAIQQASTMEELKAIKAKYAGANSAMTRASKAIGSLAKNEKKEAGKVMGKLRADFGRAYGTKEASVKAAQEAAELAVLHSSQNGGAKVAVDTTEVKNIWKANGAKPGMVLYEVYTTVYVTPREGLEEQLKKK